MRKLTIGLSFIMAALLSSCSPPSEPEKEEAEGTEGAEIAKEAIKKQEEHTEKALEEEKMKQEERRLMGEGSAHPPSGMKKR